MKALLSSCLLVCAITTAACGGGPRDPERRPSVSRENGAIVLAGAALEDGRGTVLDAMAGKIPNFRLRRTRDRCPQIALRSIMGASSISSPQVYVDGARSSDTCILETINTRDVERVEVYPLGFTTRPGYGRDAQGLILVFMRSMRPAI